MSLHLSKTTLPGLRGELREGEVGGRETSLEATGVMIPAWQRWGHGTVDTVGMGPQ